MKPTQSPASRGSTPSLSSSRSQLIVGRFTGLTSALALASLPLAAQTVTNGGFEDGTLPAFPGYATATGIIGWTGTPVDKTGINNSSGPFHDNSTIPQGARVALIQAGNPSGPASLKTTVTGLTAGTKYHVNLRANARSGTATRPWVKFSSTGLGPEVNAEVQAVGNSAAYGYLGYDFTATAASHDITITNPRPSTAGDNTLLIDDVQVTASTGAWDFTPWTGDADSGISPYHAYTHAFNLGTGDSATVNGVTFSGRTTGLAGSFSVTGLNSIAGFGTGVAQVTGKSAALVQQFLYNGTPSITLQGLQPNTQYVFTIYGAGWDAPALTGTPYRAATFSSTLGGDKFTVNLNQYGQNQGLKLSYTYTTDAQGTPVTISYPSTAFTAGTFHTSAFSNRKAAAMVGVAPMISLQPAGAIISPGSNYTLSVGATGSPDFTYQWKRNNAPISGATSSTLALTSAAFGDSGDYTVTVTNGSGSVTSSAAPVLVLNKLAGGFATGIAANGTLVTGGGTDPHYTLITNPNNQASTTALVESPIPGVWLANSATSSWIGPVANTSLAAAQNTDAGEGPGTYVYRTQIDLTGQDSILSTIRLVGSWTSDNRGMAIRVNGVASGVADPSEGHFSTLRQFVINSGLIAGVNNIDFVVTNTDPISGYTGLRVDSLSLVTIPASTGVSIIRQPTGGEAIRKDTMTLSVGALASAPLSYQWYRNGVLLGGETGAYLQLVATTADIAGNYKVTVSDGTTTIDSTTVTVTVPNNVPVAVADSLAIDANTPLQIAPALDMIFNDTDPDADLLTLAGFSATSAHGGTIVAQDDLLIYTPPLNYVGVDTFTYTVSDGWGGTSAAGTVSITVTGAATPPGQVGLILNLAGGSVKASFTGTPGATYTLQRSLTLAANSWVDVGSQVAPGNGAVEITDSSPPDKTAFYRISYAP